MSLENASSRSRTVRPSDASRVTNVKKVNVLMLVRTFSVLRPIHASTVSVLRSTSQNPIVQPSDAKKVTNVKMESASMLVKTSSVLPPTHV